MARTRKKLNVEPEEIIEDKKDAPAPKSEKAKGGVMTKRDFQSLVYGLASDAENYITEAVSLERTRATDYYKGRLPDIDKDDAEEDRSRAVLSEVRDTVLGIMPDLLRMFFGSDSVVEYQAAAEENVEIFATSEAKARQATDYIQNVVLKVDNPDFFINVYAAFQDALVRKTGVLTWYWEKTKKPVYSTHTGLTEQEAELLVADEGVTVVSKRLYIDQDAVLGPVTKYDCQIKRVDTRGRARVKGVPIENILINRGAMSSTDATLFGYHEELSQGDFVAMGYDEDELKDCDKDPNDNGSLEKQARQPLRAGMVKSIEPVHDDTQRKIRYGKLYVLADRDGDGIPELTRVTTAGTRFKILEAEPADEIPFATFCPYPEGYTFFGESVADLTMDIQRIKSRIMRDVLDSLAQSVIPQTSVLEGAVNLDDVLNPDTSRVIRTRTLGAVQPHIIPFVGKEALPVLELMTSVREARTGMSDASQGLDPKTLQSTDKDAVHATLSRAQSRIEMIARIFAETGWAQLFRGLLRLVHKNQDQTRVAQLRGGVVPISPKEWNEDMHVNVTIPLGRGSVPEQISFLTQVAAKQEQILQMLGFENPLVTISQYRYTLAKILELSGWRNTESYFNDPSKMDPAALKEMLAKVEQAKAQAAGAGATGPNPEIEMAKIKSQESIAAMKFQHQTDLKNLEHQANFHLEAMRLASQHNTTISAAEIQAHAKQASDHIDAATKVVVARIKERGNTERAEKVASNAN